MKKSIIIKTLVFIMMTMVTHKVSALNIIDENDYINNMGVQINETQLNNLRNLGFTDAEIENMDETEFSYNKDLEGEIVASSIKYYKTEHFIPGGSTYSIQNNNNSLIITTEITKEEYDNCDNNTGISPYGLSTDVVVTEYKSMYSTITSVNGRYRYKNSVTWKKLPFWRTIDVIGIGIEGNKVYPVSSSSYFKAYYSDGGASTQSGTWKKSSTGYAVTFEWPSYNLLADNFYATLYFEVDKQDSNTLTVLNAYGDYAHCQGNCNSTASIGVSIGPDGLSISGSISSKFDAISTSQATLTEINW